MTIHVKRRKIAALVAIFLWLLTKTPGYWWRDESLYEEFEFNYASIVNDPEWRSAASNTQSRDFCDWRYKKLELKNVSHFCWYGKRDDFTLVYTQRFDTASDRLTSTNESVAGKSTDFFFSSSSLLSLLIPKQTIKKCYVLNVRRIPGANRSQGVSSEDD